jgi:hypothetical protein
LIGVKPEEKPPPIFRPWRNAVDETALGLPCRVDEDPTGTAAIGETNFRGEVEMVLTTPPLDHAGAEQTVNKYPRHATHNPRLSRKGSGWSCPARGKD